jgi:hypothetical protein
MQFDEKDLVPTRLPFCELLVHVGLGFWQGLYDSMFEA